MAKLTSEQIKEQIEAAFPSHRSVAEVYDYEARIRFEVTGEDGRVLGSMPELLVRAVEEQTALADVLRQTKSLVDAKAQSPVGLDDSIRVGGQKTTLRHEHAAGRVRGMRGNKGAEIGKNPFGHWALLDGKSFPVSAADHAFLRGEPPPNA